MQQQAIRFVLMRGGTSKCLIFKENDLPPVGGERDRLLLEAFGSPDPRQIDGMGGATSLTSKACIIAPSERADIDIDYTFGQVNILRPMVDYGGSCGNCSAAVGPFAIDEGLVRAREGITAVRILNRNTQKLIVAEVPVQNGHAQCEGDFEIAGVPGKGALQRLWFYDPAGSITGRLLPSGHPSDLLEVQGSEIEISLVDAANPVVFVRARDIGLSGRESAAEIDSRPGVPQVLEEIRGKVAVMLGWVDEWQRAAAVTPGVPKIAMVAPVQVDRHAGTSEQVDFVARIMSMGRCHAAYALTGAIATGAAAHIPGSIVHGVRHPDRAERAIVQIGHPTGVIDVDIETDTARDGAVRIVRAAGYRTARRIADGTLYMHHALER
ncbi:MAG: PrpF protein [Ktedonobacteraceae bacterium]|nr:PrpF protein [Ktedonobacteraceae bacterium]MBO0791427.1 PrpF protein [Ktedonobacteraceae bacterium]